jgi:hypothetical protein
LHTPDDECGGVRDELIGDRFLSNGRFSGLVNSPLNRSMCCVDLATGGTAEVIVRSFEHEWPAIEKHLEAEVRMPRGVPLVDYGRINASQWFEARAPDVKPRARDRGATGSVVEELVQLAGAPAVGIRHHRVQLAAAETPAAVSVLARQLRTLGFVTIRAGAGLPGAIRAALCHRHVAIVSCHRDDEGAIVRWIRELATVSPRAHVVIEFAPANLLRVRSTRRRPGDWTARTRDVAAAANALIDRSALEHAEALLAAADAEAAVRRAPSPPTVDAAWARLRTRQERMEEARMRRGAGVRDRLEEGTDASGTGYSVVAAAGARR